MYREYDESTKIGLLTLPGVRVKLWGPQQYTAIKNGIEQSIIEPESEGSEEIRQRMGARDWRGLRSRLIALDGENLSQAAAWLTEAGYVPEAWAKIPPTWRPIDGVHWSPDAVDVGLLHWLIKRRDAVKWLMSLEDRDEFRKSVKKARALLRDQTAMVGAGMTAQLNASALKIKAPEEDFLKTIGAPLTLDPNVLRDFFLGAGRGLGVPAFFQWDQDGSPVVIVHAPSPMQAIGLSVHIDRFFSKRQWINCAKCGKSFEKEKRTDRFCSKTCKNASTTAARRKRVDLLEEVEAEWNQMLIAERKGLDRWKWIAVRTSERAAKASALGRDEITPEWAKRQLQKPKKKGK